MGVALSKPTKIMRSLSFLSYRDANHIKTLPQGRSQRSAARFRATSGEAEGLARMLREAAASGVPVRARSGGLP